MGVVRSQIISCNLSMKYLGFYSWNECFPATSCWSTTDLCTHMTLLYILSALLVEFCCYLKILFLNVLSVFTDVSISYIVGKQVIGRQFLGKLVSLDFGRRSYSLCKSFKVKFRIGHSFVETVCNTIINWFKNI